MTTPDSIVIPFNMPWPALPEDAKGSEQCTKLGHMYTGGYCLYCDHKEPEE